MALDLLALADHVVAEARAGAAIRAQQTAEHANERRLAAAVRPEKAVDFARSHLEVDGIHDRAPVEALRHPAHVDGELRAHGENSTSTGWPGCNFAAVAASNPASTMNTSFCRLSRL